MRDLNELFAAFAVETSVRIELPPDPVWDLVTDVSRMKFFSPEVIDAEWLDDAPQPVVGGRFEGTSLLGNFKWKRVCTVTDADRPKRFGYDVGDRFDGAPSARWHFDLEPDGDGTILQQSFSHAATGRSGTRLLADAEPDKAEEIIEARRQMLERGMKETLVSMKESLERG